MTRKYPLETSVRPKVMVTAEYCTAVGSALLLGFWKAKENKKIRGEGFELSSAFFYFPLPSRRHAEARVRLRCRIRQLPSLSGARSSQKGIALS
jgi:hypothetical protein